jgi:hypothetical protein
VTHSIPPGSILILSRKGEKDAQDHSKWQQHKDILSTRDYHHFFSKDVNWVNHFKMIIRTPEKAVEELELSLDEIHDYLKTFHIVRPIQHDKRNKSSTINTAIGHFLEFMKVSGIPTITCESLMTRDKNDGLVACTCSTYLHYVMCIHSFCILKKRGIIKGWIPTLDPTPMAKRGGHSKKAMGSGKSALLNSD